MSTPNRRATPRDSSQRARKQQLFEAGEPQEPDGVRKPFAQYLRETPARPLSPGIKAALGGTAVIVVLLLILALLRPARTRTQPTTTDLAPSATARLVG